MASERSSHEATGSRKGSVRRRLGAIGVACGSVLVLAGAVAGVTLASSGGTAPKVAATRGGRHHHGMHRHHGKHGRAGKGSRAHAAGVFFVRCPYSHSANDDPILMPGRPGAAMLHDFFGNRTTNADSTSSTLMGGPTTCITTADASAYWTPALYDNGHRVVAKRAVTYWLGASETGPTAPLPAGLQMIAGDEHATSPQPLKRLYWDCHASSGPKGTRSDGPRRSAPYQCPHGQQMRLTITFPSCWDGHSLSAVGQRNVVYPTGRGCPAGHPVALTVLRMHVFYPHSPAGRFTLSMGPGMRGSIYSAHADFLDGWKTSAIDRLIRTCLDTHSRCGAVTGPNGTPHHHPSPSPSGA